MLPILWGSPTSHKSHQMPQLPSILDVKHQKSPLIMRLVGFFFATAWAAPTLACGTSSSLNFCVFLYSEFSFGQFFKLGVVGWDLFGTPNPTRLSTLCSAVCSWGSGSQIQRKPVRRARTSVIFTSEKIVLTTLVLYCIIGAARPLLGARALFLDAKKPTQV